LCCAHQRGQGIDTVLSSSHRINVLKPIRIFRHDSWVGTGHFAETLKEKGLNYELVAIDQGDSVPDDVANIGGLAFLGGTMSVNDSFTWIRDELNLIRSASQRKLPVFGHCFGAQLISKALGGKISAMSSKEIGWHAVKFFDNDTCRQWFHHLPETIDVMFWHEDAMTIPSGGIPLYSSTHYPDQAFTIDNMIATIPHVEVTAVMLRKWLEIYSDDLAPLSASVQSAEEISRDHEQRISIMQQLTEILYNRWIDMVTAYSSL